MSVTDRERRNLYERVAQTIGETEADTLMELLPPQPYAELATRDDVLALAATVRGEMAELRGDVAKQIAALQRWAAGILAANGVALIVALST